MKRLLAVGALAVLIASSRLAEARPASPYQATPPASLSIHVYLPWTGQAPPPTLTWRNRAPLLATRSDLGAAATGGRVYVVGGRHYEGPLGPVEEYDPAADTWAARAAIPTPRSGLGVALAADGRIYAVGGLTYFPDCWVTRAVQAYDPGTDTWADRAGLPTARYGLGLAAAPNGGLYAIGGYRSLSGLDPTGVVEEYNPLTNAWRSRAPMPTPRGALAVATGADGRIYAVGGADYTTSPARFFATVEAYDPATNTWVTRAGMPTARSELALVAAPNGRLYAIGGNSTINDWLATVEEYDPVANSWRTVEPLGVARRGLAAAVAGNGRIYAIGGRYFAPRGDRNVVEEAIVRATPQAAATGITDTTGGLRRQEECRWGGVERQTDVSGATPVQPVSQEPGFTQRPLGTEPLRSATLLRTTGDAPWRRTS